MFEFDSAYRVTAAGAVEEVSGVYVPTVEHDETHDMMIDGVPYRDHGRWEALAGHTSQFGYNGPIMHASEYIGGKLRRDILSTPGVYVVVPVNVYEDDDIAGWAVLKVKQ